MTFSFYCFIRLLTCTVKRNQHKKGSVPRDALGISHLLAVAGSLFFADRSGERRRARRRRCTRKQGCVAESNTREAQEAQQLSCTEGASLRLHLSLVHRLRRRLALACLRRETRRKKAQERLGARRRKRDSALLSREIRCVAGALGEAQAS